MKTILVALDASKRAPYVLSAAITMAQAMGAKLVLYRGVGIPPEIPLNLYLGSSGDLEGLLVEQAKKDVALLAEAVPAGITSEQLVEVASPWDGICRAAVRVHAELIVIGSHGYSGLDRLLGTTAAKVVNHAACSVFVARPSA